MASTFLSCLMDLCATWTWRTDSMDKMNPMKMTYNQLKCFTGNFHDERRLGSGTFGVVFKGTLPDGEHIAVKVLHNKLDTIDGKAFGKELANLASLDHHNIVRLVGYCNDSEQQTVEYEGRTILVHNLHMALCFEFVDNKSLDEHISDANHGHEWHTRYKIIRGICDGLKYLHEELEQPMLHLDLKPENILLDKEMTPKIADFGLSRLMTQETAKQTISALGTCGYLPPEYVNLQVVSKAFDIFSLGVIIMKIMIGKEGYNDFAGRKELIPHVQNSWKMRLRDKIKPRSLDAYCQQVKTCIEVASKCLNGDHKERPQMKDIVTILEETERVIPNMLPEVEQFQDLETIPPTNESITVTSTSGTSQQSQPGLKTLPKELSTQFLQKITDGFSSEQLGHSVFGTVYKGTLPDGGFISVKKLDENITVAHDKMFATEVTNIMALKHKNIVQLVAFCQETQKKVIEHNGRNVTVDITESFLCYEYLANGSLENYLYAGMIDWDKRFKIVKGICQGLHFLHKELPLGPLVHMNLVPNTIWLDGNWEPKIADFGLSRLFGHQQTRMNTINVIGQYAYMAPEYLYRGEISTQSDIYSLGMIILEITIGERIQANDADKSARNFVEKVQQVWKAGNQIASKYPTSDRRCLQQVKTCIAIGLKCVDLERKRRPSIVDIIDKLNGKIVPIFDEE